MPAHLPLKNTVKILVILVWIFMAFLLVKKVHLVPGLPAEAMSQIRDSETYMAIHFKGQKIGYAVQSLTRLEGGYIVDDKTFLRLKLMNQVREVRTITSARLDSSMGLQSFHFFLSSGPIRFQLTGTLSGLTLSLTTLTSGFKNTSEIRLTEVPRLTTGLMAYLAQEGLKKGQQYRVAIFDPSTLGNRTVTLRVEDKETLKLDDQVYETFRVRLDYFDTQSYAWVDAQGQTVKEEGLLGLSMVRTTPEKAREGLAGRAELTDVIEATSASADRAIPDPRRVRFLKARLTGLDLAGFELDGERQRLDGSVVEVTRETIDVRHEAALPFNDPALLPSLESTSLIQRRHPKIVHQVRLIAPGETSPLKIVDRVVDWVYENLEKRPTMSVPSAVDVLETRIGDCNEHAILAVALLRAAGIPARMAVGVLYFEDRFYYHAWVEAYWGRWLAVDPILGQVPADATHIRFMTGGLDRQMEMVRVIGRLKVEVLEAR
jgi:transglutaminase-like putative cysteine protease